MAHASGVASLSYLHSDQRPLERSRLLAAFRALRPDRAGGGRGGGGGGRCYWGVRADTEEEANTLLLDDESRLAAGLAPLAPEQSAAAFAADDEDVPARGACVIAATDACLPWAAVGEPPLGVPLLVNFELPGAKDSYARRVHATLGVGARSSAVGGMLGGGGGSSMRARVVLNVVAAADAATLRAMETAVDGAIEEMPMDLVSNLLLQHRRG